MGHKHLLQSSYQPLFQNFPLRCDYINFCSRKKERLFNQCSIHIITKVIDILVYKRYSVCACERALSSTGIMSAVTSIADISL